MYEMHNDTEGFLNEGTARDEFDVPAPLESWSLADFIDLIVPNGMMASAADLQQAF